METAPAASQPPAPQHAGSGFATLTRGQLVFTIAGMLLTLLLAAMDQTIVGIAMPRVVESLNGFDRYPWVTTSYLLTSTIAVPVFAKLSDLYGRKWFYLSGAVIFVLSSCLCGAAGNVPLPLDGMNQLIFFRGLQGIGGGAIIGLSFTIIGDLFSPAERGRYQGLFGAVFGVASVVGPILGGWITDNFSWRWIFYVNAPLGVLAVAVLYYKFPHFRPHLKKRVIDWAGVAALCAWLTPLLLALSEVGLGGWGSPRVQGMLAFSAAVFALFIWIETRAVEPLLPLSLFKNSSMALTSAGIFLLGVAMFGAFLYIPLYLQSVYGSNAEEAGSLFTALMMSMVVGSIFAGQTVARTGKYKIFLVSGAAITAIGMYLLAEMNPAAGHWELVRNLFLCGLGFGFLQPIYTLVAQNAAPTHQMGIATASTQFFRAIGSTIGVAVFGSVLLRLYHERFDALIPANTPASALLPFHNPLQIYHMRHILDIAFARIPHGDALLRTLFDNVKSGMSIGLHVIFLLSAIVMAATFLVNLVMKEVPLRKARH